jgi:hypothetical protein
MSGFMLRNGDRLEFTMNGTYVYVTLDFPNTEDTWIHIVGVYRGAAWNSTNCDVYMNGAKVSTIGTSTTALNISGTAINIGSSPGGGQPFVGSIANARLFNRALTGDEVWQLYAYQKEYFNVSPDVVTFKGGRLDVQGTALFNGNVGIGTNNPGVPLDIRTTGDYNGIGILGSSSGRYTLSTNTNGNTLQMSNGDYSFGRWAQAHHYDVFSAPDFTGARALYLNYFSGGSVLLAGGVAVSSDDRIKTEERYIENATETLLKLKPQIYLKGPNIGSTSNVSRIESGLIAQDVYYDAPELRHLVSLADDAEPTETKPYTDDDPQNDPDYSSWGSKSAGLEYEGLIPYLIKSNQEIYTELQAEKARNDALETQLASVLARLDALESA